MNQIFESELQKHLHQNKSGWIEVVCGSMFSGKTEELIRRITRALIAKQSVKIFKPVVDVRYSKNEVVSHNKNTVGAFVISESIQILDLAKDCDVVGIDEAQFFDLELPNVCQELANQGKRVIIAGLDMDYKGIPFGAMPVLLSVAEFVTKVHAICLRCGGLAAYSHRLDSTNEETILLGETDRYEPLCRNCFQHATLKNSALHYQ